MGPGTRLAPHAIPDGLAEVCPADLKTRHSMRVIAAAGNAGIGSFGARAALVRAEFPYGSAATRGSRDYGKFCVFPWIWLSRSEPFRRPLIGQLQLLLIAILGSQAEPLRSAPR